MRDVLIALLCLYFAVQNTRQLTALPFGQWDTVQWVLAVTTLVLYAMGVYMAVRVVRAMTVAQKRAKAEADRLRTEADAEPPDSPED